MNEYRALDIVLSYLNENLEYPTEIPKELNVFVKDLNKNVNTINFKSTKIQKTKIKFKLSVDDKDRRMYHAFKGILLIAKFPEPTDEIDPYNEMYKMVYEYVLNSLNSSKLSEKFKVEFGENELTGQVLELISTSNLDAEREKLIDSFKSDKNLEDGVDFDYDDLDELVNARKFYNAFTSKYHDDVYKITYSAYGITIYIRSNENKNNSLLNKYMKMSIKNKDSIDKYKDKIVNEYINQKLKGPILAAEKETKNINVDLEDISCTFGGHSGSRKIIFNAEIFIKFD